MESWLSWRGVQGVVGTLPSFIRERRFHWLGLTSRVRGLRHPMGRGRGHRPGAGWGGPVLRPALAWRSSRTVEGQAPWTPSGEDAEQGWAAHLPPLSLRGENASNLSSLASDSLQSLGCLRRDRNWAWSFVGFSLLCGLGFCLHPLRLKS